VGATDPGELVELGAAGEPVGQDDRVAGRADGGQQGGLGHGGRDVVVAALDAEVAGQATAAPHRGDLGTGPGQQRGVGVPAHHGVVVAVRLGDRAHAAEVRRIPSGRAGQQFGQRAGGGLPGRRGCPAAAR
jgi:hypothetical protein